MHLPCEKTQIRVVLPILGTWGRDRGCGNFESRHAEKELAYGRCSKDSDTDQTEGGSWIPRRSDDMIGLSSFQDLRVYFHAWFAELGTSTVSDIMSSTSGNKNRFTALNTQSFLRRWQRDKKLGVEDKYLAIGGAGYNYIQELSR